MENAHSRLSSSSSPNDAPFASTKDGASRIAETRAPSVLNRSLCASDRSAPASANVHAVAASSAALEPTHARAAARAKASDTEANETSAETRASVFRVSPLAAPPRVAQTSVVMFAAVNASASARALIVARMAVNSACAPRAASLAYAQAAFTRSWLLKRSSRGSVVWTRSRSASNSASSGWHALANAQTAFAMSREGMSESDKVCVARRVSARATPEKRSLRPASSPALALACAQATFASARASKASRAHIAVETRASASNRASSKKSRLANAQLDAATSRALKAAAVSFFAKASSATRDTRDVVSAAKRRQVAEAVF